MLHSIWPQNLYIEEIRDFSLTKFFFRLDCIYSAKGLHFASVDRLQYNTNYSPI